MPPKRTKVLHITSSLKTGGAEAVLCDIVSTLTACEHSVIYFHDGPHRTCLQNLGIKHYHIPYGPLFFIRLFWRVRAINPDCIHTLLWAANIAGRVAGFVLRIPVASVWHNNIEQDGRLRNSFDRLTSGLATRLVAVSQGVLESVHRARYPKRDAISIIANGINGARVQELSKEGCLDRAKLGLSSDHFVIGSVGRFVPVKRYDFMLEAFALLYKQHAHARLVLVGTGELEADLCACARTLAIEQAVIFVVGKQAYGYYPLFDCFSLSSDKEGISIALLEAMSFELACVVTHADRSHAVLAHGVNGLLADAGDADGLAQQWGLLAKDIELKKRLGNAAKATVQSSFSSARMCEQYRDIFEQLARFKTRSW